MSISRVTLVKLLRETNETDEIGGKLFESRYDLLPFDGPGLIGIRHEEVRPEFRERDRHLLYARDQELLNFQVQELGERQEFFGGVVKITPKGLEYLDRHTRSWWANQLKALGQNIVTILVAVIIALISAWVLKIAGLKE